MARSNSRRASRLVRRVARARRARAAGHRVERSRHQPAGLVGQILQRRRRVVVRDQHRILLDQHLPDLAYEDVRFHDRSKMRCNIGLEKPGVTARGLDSALVMIYLIRGLMPPCVNQCLSYLMISTLSGNFSRYSRAGR